MRTWFHTFLLGAVLGVAGMVFSPGTASADDDYWDGYWSWYDNTYQPYYYRQYNSPRYRYNDGRFNDGRFNDGRFNDGRYYGGRNNFPQTRYYGTPRFGYREVPGAGGQVRVGPLRFGWW